MPRPVTLRDVAVPGGAVPGGVPHVADGARRDPADPARADAPVLLVSGECSLVPLPCRGDEAARHQPHGRRLMVPAAHVPGAPCLDRMIARFRERGATASLDTACVRDMALPPFVLPGT